MLAVMKIHLSKSLPIFLLRDRLLAVFSVLMIGESQAVLGDGREIGECETKGSHLIASAIEDEFSALQSGVSHFQTRRNGYG